MVEQGFYIGDRDWWMTIAYDVDGDRDFHKIFTTLTAAGSPLHKAAEACMILAEPNTGYTFTNFDDLHATFVFNGHATSSEEMYSTIQHELKHIVEHISEYYGVEPRSEESAYLQGEIARNMYSAASAVICPVAG